MMGPQRDLERDRRRTLLLVSLASIMERADEALLPAVYREIGAALHADPTWLGALTLCRSIVQAACYPLAAYAAARHNRAHVIAVGAFLWAAATFLVGISDTFAQVAISRGLNGIGLALVVPSIQSLVADSTDDGTRGSAFGWLQLASCIGLISGGFVGLLLAQTTVLGIAGWRIAFHLVAVISVAVGALNWFFSVDPHFPTGDAASAGAGPGGSEQPSARRVVEDMIAEAKFVVRIPTFQIFVAQGVSGSFPWSALSFASMWLELIGFSHRGTAVLMTIFWVASSLGGLIGGKMGDALARRYPDAGRIVLSQISAGSAVPLAAVLLLGLPDDPSTGVIHGIVLFVMGVCISWNGPATNFPIFAEIVPEKSRTSIYALDRSFETVLSSFAPPIVGILAQRVYGYRPDDKGLGPRLDRENAASLAKALYTAIAIPFTVCTAIYSFLYCSYPRDRDRARMQSLAESELQQMEHDGSCLEDGHGDGGSAADDLRCTDTAETPRIGGRTRSDTRIRPDTLGYVSRTYQAIFGFLEKENNSDTGRIRMGYVSEGSEGYRTFRLESLGIYAACRDGTTHPICILTFHLGGDDAASDRRQHLLLRCRPVAGEQTPPPSAAGQLS